MVLMLAETLDLPFRARNHLLTSAGFAATYAETPLDAAALAPVRHALEFMMERHAPFPALICDRHWNLVNANATARLLLGVGDHVAGVNLVRLIATQPAFREAIVNWAEVVGDFRQRVRLEARTSGNDPILSELAGVLDALDVAEPEGKTDPGSPFMALKMRQGDLVLSLFSTIASFGTARDITVNDLRIELFFPADEATAQILRGLGPGG